MEKYWVIIEKAKLNYSAFSPDLPGCITVGSTIDETVSSMKEAIELFLESLLEDGKTVPFSKDLRHYMEQGVFDEEQIGEEYYIARVEVHLPRVAA